MRRNAKILISAMSPNEGHVHGNQYGNVQFSNVCQQTKFETNRSANAQTHAIVRACLGFVVAVVVVVVVFIRVFLR